MSELIRIDNLIVAFGEEKGNGSVAVDGVDLTLGQGETLALVGESGCGKTVMCKSMLGFLCARGHIDGGTIDYRGADLARLTEKELVGYRGSEIAMIPQDPMTSLDPMVGVGEQIAEAVRVAGSRTAKIDGTEAKERAVRLMEEVGIENARSRYDDRPYQFSGGMRQRIVIAIALAGEPSLLLADEPTTALDEHTQKEVLALTKKLQKQSGFGMLFITHDLHLVGDMAERVAIMKDGRIIEEGPVEKVFEDPEQDYTKQLLRYLDYYANKGHSHRTLAQEDTLLEVKGLNKSYGDKQVLRDLDLEAHKGEILGIVGRSGCGKSTLAGCIMGIEPYESGRISITGGAGSAQMIFQGSQEAFNERMTIGDIIAEPLRIRYGRKMRKAEMKEQVLRVMDEVGLDRELIARRPYELSGGQRQRAAIARAIIPDPAIIVADEPLTGLDVTAQAKIVHLFRELVDRRGLGLLLIAHDRPMVEHVSNRIIELD